MCANVQIAIEPPLRLEKMSTQKPNFTLARNGRPQCIAHRGYKAAWPENTMGAFVGAVDIGAHAIETDIHLSKDGIVVISHDASLKRCFGENANIIDCDWDYLRTLRTLKAPHEPMPRLKDLLEYLASPGMEDIWIILDIKLDNDQDDVIRLIAETLEEVKPSKSKPWNERIMMGCWAAKYLPICTKYLPSYPIVHIGFNISYARQFLKVPGVSFNMNQHIMVGPTGDTFLKDIKRTKRAIFFWTVNDEVWMKWSICKGVDGIITDDPKKYLEVRDSYKNETKANLPMNLWASILVRKTLGELVSLLFRCRYGFKIDVAAAKKSIEGTTTTIPPT